MRFQSIPVLCFLFILFAVSCTVQKRVYRQGFFVEQRFKNKQSPKQTLTRRSAGKPELVALTGAATIQETQIASVELYKEYTLPKKSGPESCDSLYLKDGSVIAVKVKELGLKDIRYKLCDFEEGPDYIVEKFRVSHIRFSNGSTETIEKQSPPPAPKTKPQETYVAPKGMESNGNAITSLTFAILGIYPLVLIGSIIGLIFGMIAKNQIRQNPGRYNNEKAAKAGFMISAISLFFWIALIFLALLI